MTNNELRALLTAEKATLEGNVLTLQTVIASLQPKRLTEQELRALNLMGLTLPPDPAPESEHLSGLQGALESVNYHRDNLTASLDSIAANNDEAEITIRDVMAWGMVGREEFTDVPKVI